MAAEGLNIGYQGDECTLRFDVIVVIGVSNTIADTVGRRIALDAD